MNMGHCCCGAHSCTTENKKNASTSIVHEYWKVGLSFILLIGGIIMNALNFAFFLGEYVALIWYILAYLPVGIPVMKEAWEGIREKDYFSEFTLMIVATLGAFYIGEYPEGVAVMLFYTIGELFQNKAVDRISPIDPLAVTTAICLTPSTNFPFRGEIICRRLGESLPEVVKHSL